MASPSAASKKVLLPMADYGNDPTEVAIPYSVFKAAGFSVDFATETGASPAADKKMIEGVTGSLLGADAKAKKAYQDMVSLPTEHPGSIKHPLSWTDFSFSLESYDLVFLPGGHEKGVRQLIDAKPLHRHLATYFPLTARDSSTGKVLAAICHGVQVLAFTPDPSSPTPEFPLAASGKVEQGKPYKSIIHSCKTTALPGFMESGIYGATRLFLGDYYKTYGAGTPNVEDYVKAGLDDPKTQFDAGPPWYSGGATTPFKVEDEKYRYVSGRFPPDAELVAKRAVELILEAHK